MTEEQQKLVEQNHNLIYFYLHKYHYSIEEFYDVAAIGLCKAAIHYDGNISAFSTFALKCIHNEVMCTIRSAKATHRIPESKIDSLSQQTYNEDDKLKLEGLLSDVVDVEDEAVVNAAFEKFWDSISEEDREILRLVSEGYTQKDIGSRLGTCQVTVSRRIEKLKNAFLSLLDGRKR